MLVKHSVVQYTIHNIKFNNLINIPWIDLRVIRAGMIETIEEGTNASALIIIQKPHSSANVYYHKTKTIIIHWRVWVLIQILLNYTTSFHRILSKRM